MGICRFGGRKRDSLLCPEEYIQTLNKITRLKTGQIIYLYKCFCNLAKDTDKVAPLHLRKSHFLSLGSLQRNPILSILLRSMFGEKKRLNFIDFAEYLSVFQAYSSQLKPKQLEDFKEKKIKMVFNMFDRNMDGIIDEEDLIFVIHKLFSDIFTTKQIMNVAFMMMSEMDTSNTHQILFSDFCKAWEIFDMDMYLITRIPN